MWLNDDTATPLSIFGSDTSSQPNGIVVADWQRSTHFLVTPSKFHFWFAKKSKVSVRASRVL